MTAAIRRWRDGDVEQFQSYVSPADERERAHVESLIRNDFARCHRGETLDDIKRRASFSKEDRRLLRDWMAIAATRASIAAKPRYAREYCFSSRTEAEGLHETACDSSHSSPQDGQMSWRLRRCPLLPLASLDQPPPHGSAHRPARSHENFCRASS